MPRLGKILRRSNRSVPESDLNPFPKPATAKAAFCPAQLATAGPDSPEIRRPGNFRRRPPDSLTGYLP
jgi:hypothetical protein